MPREDAAFDDVHDFVDDYGKALVGGDGDAIADFWDVPALVVGKEGVIAVDDRNEVRGFFASAAAQYRAYGITDTDGEVIVVTRVGDRIVEVEVRWAMLDADGNERGAERSTYTLRKDDDGQLRIRMVVSHPVEGGPPELRGH